MLNHIQNIFITSFYIFTTHNLCRYVTKMYMTDQIQIKTNIEIIHTERKNFFILTFNENVIM